VEAVESSGRAALAVPSLAELPGALLEASPAETGLAQVVAALPAEADPVRCRRQVVVELQAAAGLARYRRQVVGLVAAERGLVRAVVALRSVETGPIGPPSVEVVTTGLAGPEAVIIMS
jgi:hypothetical protein